MKITNQDWSKVNSGTKIKLRGLKKELYFMGLCPWNDKQALFAFNGPYGPFCSIADLDAIELQRE